MSDTDIGKDRHHTERRTRNLVLEWDCFPERLIVSLSGHTGRSPPPVPSGNPESWSDALVAHVARVAERHGLAVTYVANAWMQTPRGPRFRTQVVAGAFDAADDWIVEQLGPADVVITADIPLASRCLKKGARVLGPSGKPFTDDNIGNALATRELMADLRAYGVGGGPPPFGPRDRSRFLDALELVVRETKRQRAGR
jgi:uncharacterized protein YaiI (UPF0178 family)